MAVFDVKEERSTAATGAKAAYGLLGLVLVGYCVSLVIRHTGDTGWVDGWGVASFELLVTLLVLIRALVDRRDRAFAALLGLGMCAWAIGDFANTIESLGGAGPPTLSAANILWYCFFPLAYVGMMVLMRRDVRKFTVANYLDGVIASLVTGALFAAFAFTAIVKWSDGDSSFAAVNVIYPLADLLLLILCALPIFMLAPGKRARWYLLSAACLVNAAGDVAALFPGIVATHVGFFFNSMAWPASLFLISSAVWVTKGTPGEAAEHKASGFAIPTAAAALSLFVLLVSSLAHTGQVAIALATLTLVAAGVRFGMTLKRLNAINQKRHEQLAEAAEAERRSREDLQATVRQYSDFASRVADGDLTATVAAAGSEELAELAASLNRMVAGLGDISSEIQTGVQYMGNSTAEILAVVSQHTESANHQSAAIQQTSCTVDELRGAADITAGKAEEVAERARASLAVSDQGASAVASIAAAMEDIRDRVDGIAHGITTLSECSQQIGEITATVNGLADRSNLLALNASIEAARAGEHGKGFAVVADQVRSLAEQSKGATAQVEAILHDIQAATDAAVKASQQGTEVVAHGIDLAGQAGDGIRSLTETIRAASDAAQDIAASVQQQSASMVQIAAAMQEISAGTSHFVEGAEQSQRAAQDLNDLSGKLTALTERYRVA